MHEISASLLTKEEEWNLLQYLIVNNSLNDTWKKRLEQLFQIQFKQNEQIHIDSVQLVDSDNKDVEITSPNGSKIICIILHNFIRKELNCFVDNPVIPLSLSPGTAIFFDSQCVLADCIACTCTITLQNNTRKENSTETVLLEDALHWFENLQPTTLSLISNYIPVLQSHWLSLQNTNELRLLQIMNQISVPYSILPIPIIVTLETISSIESFLFSKFSANQLQRKEMLFFIATNAFKTKNLICEDASKSAAEIIQMEREFQHYFYQTNNSNFVEIEADAQEVQKYGEWITKYEYTVGDAFYTGSIYKALVILFYPNSLWDSLQSISFTTIPLQTNQKRALQGTENSEISSKKQKL